MWPPGGRPPGLHRCPQSDKVVKFWERYKARPLVALACRRGRGRESGKLSGFNTFCMRLWPALEPSPTRATVPALASIAYACAKGTTMTSSLLLRCVIRVGSAAAVLAAAAVAPVTASTTPVHEPPSRRTSASSDVAPAASDSDPSPTGTGSSSSIADAEAALEAEAEMPFLSSAHYNEVVLKTKSMEVT